MDSLIFTTVLYFIMTILFLISAFIKREFMTAYLLSCGASVVGAALGIMSITQESEYLLALSISPIGLIMIILGANIVIAHHRCNIAITAKCIGYSTGSHKGIRWYYPTLSYLYLGKKYEITSFSACAKSTVKEMMEEKEVTVFINPKNPKICAVKRNPNLGPSEFCMVIGVLVMLISIVLPLL